MNVTTRRTCDAVSRRTSHGARRTALIGLIVLAALSNPLFAQDRAASPNEPSGVHVRITSPLGRSGTYGRIRIVAQITTPPEVTLGPVRFFVDGNPAGEDTDGAPYAVEWLDENPFERREIAVTVTDSLGVEHRDLVVLPPYEYIEEAEVTSVLVEASVYDPDGRFVPRLERDDFTLFEDGVMQTLDVVSQTQVPSTFILLVDSSQSMSRRMDFVRRAADRMSRYIRPIDRVIVVPFAMALLAVTGPTDDRATMSEAISAIQPGGGTAILDAIVDAARLFDGAEGRRILVLITDGYDENSSHTMEDALKAIGGQQATTYVIAIGGIAGISLKGERLLRQIATETGGKAFFPPREEELPAVYDLLASDAHGRYLLAYTPANQVKDGGWRALEVKTRDESHTVRARTGYFAPKPPPVRPSIEFTVTDAESGFVDVSADELVVIEDGVEQRIENFHEAVAPVSIVLALDASGSMRRATDAVIAAAREFVAALRPEDSLSIALFADDVVFAHDLSTNRKQSAEVIGDYVANGGTALYDAIGDSLTRLSTVDGRRAIVVVTDGRDEDNPGTGPGSASTFQDVLAKQKEVGAVIFGIGLGPNVDRRTLEDLAAVSGGHAYFPEDVTSLAADYGRIVENLRRRFVVGYTSTNSNRDGAWRVVDLQARTPSLTVTSAGGYFAPAK